MKNLVNINMGIDSKAKSYLAVKGRGVTFRMDSGKKFFPDGQVYSRTGSIPSVELFRYKLKDGNFAEEFVQNVFHTDDGKRIYFLGLNYGEKNIIWPVAKMRERISRQICSN